MVSCSTSITHRVTLVTDDKSLVRQGLDGNYDKRNIYVIICDLRQILNKSWRQPLNVDSNDINKVGCHNYNLQTCYFLCNNTHRNEDELFFVFESGIIFVCKIIIAEKN